MIVSKMTEGDLINLKASCVKFVIDGLASPSAEAVVKEATTLFDFLTGDLGKESAE